MVEEGINRRYLHYLTTIASPVPRPRNHPTTTTPPPLTRKEEGRPVARLSPSFATTIEQCPLRARWLRTDKAERATPDADTGLRAGRATHTALEQFYNRVRAARYEGPLHTPTWLTTARRCVEAAVAKEGPFDDETITNIRLQMLDYLLDQHEYNHIDLLGTEQFIQISLRQGTNVVGFIDRLERRGPDTLAVIDYKGGYRRWHPDLIRSELQTQTYTWVASTNHPWAERIVVEIAMLGHRDTASALWTKRDIPRLAESLRTRYLAADDAFTNGPWLPNPDDWCDRCEFKANCPAFGGTPQVGTWDPDLGRKRTDDDATPSLFNL
jgi:putative RecB family exonuclease